MKMIHNKMLFMLLLATAAGCDRVYPPAFTNGTDARMEIQYRLADGRECSTSLNPATSLWTSRGPGEQVTHLIVDERSYDLSVVPNQCDEGVLFMIRKEEVVVLQMKNLPKKWQERSVDELASLGKQTLKPK